MVAGAGADAVDAGSQFDDIEIEFENARLAQEFFHAAGEDDLAQLAQHRLLPGEEEVFGQLLGDGRGPPGEALLLQIVAQRFAHRLHVDPLMAVEAGILGDDDRPFQGGGNRLMRGPVAVFRADDKRMLFPLPVAHDDAERGARVLEKADVGEAPEDGENDRARPQKQEEGGGEEETAGRQAAARVHLLGGRSR